jgi:hypothetical protein
VEIIDGETYRVIKAPAWEYLTVGEVYLASTNGPKDASLGLHRPSDGRGTVVRRGYVTNGLIVLERVQPAHHAELSRTLANLPPQRHE